MTKLTIIYSETLVVTNTYMQLKRRSLMSNNKQKEELQFSNLTAAYGLDENLLRTNIASGLEDELICGPRRLHKVSPIREFNYLISTMRVSISIQGAL